MWALSVGFALGAAAALLWPFAWIIYACAAPPLAWRFAASRLPLLAAAVAWLWCSAVAQGQLSARVSEVRHADVAGCVVSPVVLDGNRIRFALRTVLVDGRERRQRLLLAWYDGTQVPAEGQCWRLRVRLRPPRGLLNHTGDDAERRAFLSGVHGYGSVINTAPAEHYGDSASQTLLHARLRLARRVRFVAGEGRGRALFMALGVGLRHGLDAQDWAVFQRTGTGHLVAISGLHIGLLASVGYLFGRGLLGPLFHQIQRYRGRHAVAVDARVGWFFALLFALVYAALAGFALPTVRALIMAVVFGVAALARVRLAARDALALALLLVLIGAPLSVIRPGTWLSFAAVGVLLTLGVRPARGLMAAQGVVFAGLLPVMAVFLGTLSWVSPLANAVCVPLFSVVVIPATLLCVTLSVVHPPAARAGFDALETVVDATWSYLEPLARLPWTDLALPAPDLWRTLLATVGVALWLCAIPAPRQRLLAVCACLPLIFARERGPAFGEVAIEVYDVGQALSVLIRTRRHALLYDTGARWRTRDAGSAVVVPALRAAGVGALDRLVISHRDLDHRGGAESVRAAFAGADVVVGERLPSFGGEQTHCREVPPWRWDGVRFSFVHPRPGVAWQGNNASCVLRVESRAGVALLTGDAEALAELSLVHSGQSMRANLVIGQHHGSATSSTQTFVQATGARRVIFSTGFHNQWGLPAAAVVQRWERSGARVWTTARDGGLRLSLSLADGAAQVRGARRARSALWRSIDEPAAAAK